MVSQSFRVAVVKLWQQIIMRTGELTVQGPNKNDRHLLNRYDS